MAQNFFIGNLLSYLSSLIKEINFATEAKVITSQEMKRLPAPPALSDWLDFVLIEFVGFSNEYDTDVSINSAEQNYEFRIWQALNCSSAENITNLKEQESRKIMEKLSDNLDLQSLSLASNAKKYWMVVNNCQFDNELNDLFLTHGVKATAVLITLAIKLVVRREKS